MIQLFLGVIYNADKTVPVEINLANVSDMGNARKSAEKEALNKSFTELFESLRKTHFSLLKGKKLRLVKRRIFKNPGMFLKQTKDVKEVFSPDGVYKWKASLVFDVSLLIREVNLIVTGAGRKTLNIYSPRKLPLEYKKSIRDHFPDPLFRLSFRKRSKVPPRCYAYRCVHVKISAMKNRHKVIWSYREKRKMKTELLETDDAKKMFMVLPENLLKYLKVPTLVKKKFIIKGINDPVQLLKIAYIVKMQMPGIYYMDTFSFLHSGLDVSVRVHPDIAESFVSTLYLGEDLAFQTSTQVSGAQEILITPVVLKSKENSE